MADVEKQNQVLEEEGPATEEEVAVEVERPSEEAVNEGVKKEILKRSSILTWPRI